MKKLFNSIISYFKKDWRDMQLDLVLRQEQRLANKANRRAYKWHLAFNKRYYLLRLTRNYGLSLPLRTADRVYNRRSCILIMNTAQLDQLKLMIGSTTVNRMKLSGDIAYIDGHYSRELAITLKKVKRLYNNGA